MKLFTGFDVANLLNGNDKCQSWVGTCSLPDPLFLEAIHK